MRTSVLYDAVEGYKKMILTLSRQGLDRFWNDMLRPEFRDQCHERLETFERYATIYDLKRNE